MIKRLLVIALILFFAHATKAETTFDEFTPFGAEPVITLEKQSSETRELPSLDFYDGIIPIVTTDAIEIESGLIYDDLPIREVYLDDSVARPTIILPTNLFNSPTIKNRS